MIVNTPPVQLNFAVGAADMQIMRSGGWPGRLGGAIVALALLGGSGCAVAEARVEAPTAPLGQVPSPQDGSVGTPDTDLGRAPASDGSLSTPDTNLGRAPRPADGSVGTPDGAVAANARTGDTVDLGAPPEPAFDPREIDPADYPGQGVGDAPPDYFVYPDDD